MYVAPESKLLVALANATGASQPAPTRNPNAGEEDEWD